MRSRFFESVDNFKIPSRNRYTTQFQNSINMSNMLIYI